MPERLTESLIRRGLLDAGRAREAIQRQVLLGGALDTCLFELQLVEEHALLEALGSAYGLPTASLSESMGPVDPAALRAFPSPWARKHALAPLSLNASEGVLTVLSPAPADISLLARLGELLELTVRPRLAPEFRVHQRLALLYDEQPVDRFRALIDRFGGRAALLTTPQAAALPSKPAAPADLAQAVIQLQAARDRDDIVRTALAYSHRELDLAAMFRVREQRFEGWSAEGEGAENIGRVAISLEPNSAFRTVFDSGAHYLGPLPSDEFHRNFLAQFGRKTPRTVLLVPVRIRGRTIAIFYGENGDKPIPPRLATDLMLLATHVQGALEALLLRRKAESLSELPSKAQAPASAAALDPAPSSPLMAPFVPSRGVSPTPVRPPASTTTPVIRMALPQAPALAHRTLPPVGASDPTGAASFDPTARHSPEEHAFAESPTLPGEILAPTRAELGLPPASSGGAAPFRAPVSWPTAPPGAPPPGEAHVAADPAVAEEQARAADRPPNVAAELGEHGGEHQDEGISAREEGPVAEASPADASPSSGAQATAGATNEASPRAEATETSQAGDENRALAGDENPALAGVDGGTAVGAEGADEPTTPSSEPQAVAGTTDEPRTAEALSGADEPLTEAAQQSRPMTPWSEVEGAGTHPVQRAGDASQGADEPLASGPDAPALRSPDPRSASRSKGQYTFIRRSTGSADIDPLWQTAAPAPPGSPPPVDESGSPSASTTGSESALGFASVPGAVPSQPEVVLTTAVSPFGQSPAHSSDPWSDLDDPNAEAHSTGQGTGLVVRSGGSLPAGSSSPLVPLSGLVLGTIASGPPNTQGRGAWTSLPASWPAGNDGPTADAWPTNSGELEPHPLDQAFAEALTPDRGGEDLLRQLDRVIDSARGPSGDLPNSPPRPSETNPAPNDEVEPKTVVLSVGAKAEAVHVVTRSTEGWDSVQVETWDEWAKRASGGERASLAELVPPEDASEHARTDQLSELEQSFEDPVPLTRPKVSGAPAGTAEDPVPLTRPASGPRGPDSGAASPASEPAVLVAEEMTDELPRLRVGRARRDRASIEETPASPVWVSPVSLSDTPAMPTGATSSPPTGTEARSTAPKAAEPSAPATPDAANPPLEEKGEVGAPTGSHPTPERTTVASGTVGVSPGAVTLGMVSPGSAQPAAALGGVTALPGSLTGGHGTIHQAAVDPELAKDIEALVGPNADARRAARDRLIAIGPAVLPSVMQKFPGVTRVDPFSSQAALPLFPECGELLAILAAFGLDAHLQVLRRLDAPEAVHRFFASYFYAHVAVPEAIPRLLQRLHDEEPRVCMLAARTLFTYRERPEFQSVIDHLHGRLVATSLVARKHAAHLVGLFRDVTAVPLLIEVFELKDKPMFEAVEHALAEITKQNLGTSPRKWQNWWKENQDRSRIGWLIEGLASKDSGTRRSSSEELRALTGQDFGFDPLGSRKEREDARRRWNGWWETQLL